MPIREIPICTITYNQEDYKMLLITNKDMVTVNEFDERMEGIKLFDCYSRRINETNSKARRY